MIHKESSRVKVYHSQEYERFKMIDGNRKLNEHKINRIINDIRDGIDVLRYYPIQVYQRGETLDIKDGQHRFAISKKLGKPVFYVLMQDDNSLLDVAKINSNVEKWKNKDFLESNIQLGNRHYQVLKDFMEKYDLGYTLSIRLLSSGKTFGVKANTSMADIFQRGAFEANYYESAIALAEKCMLFKTFKHWRSSSFFAAVQKIEEYAKVEIDKIAKNHERYPEELKWQPSYREYIANLSVVFNKHRHSLVIIYEDKKQPNEHKRRTPAADSEEHQK